MTRETKDLPNPVSHYDSQDYLGFINRRLVEQVKNALLECCWQDRPEIAVLEMARQTILLADHLVGQFESINRLPEPIACGPGCCSCCCNQVEVIPPEALLIGHYLDQHFPRWKESRLQERLARLLHKKAGKTKVELAKMRRTLPCPLLKKRHCSVYPVRPLVCRAMHALSKEHCQMALASQDRTEVPFYAHRYEIILSVSRGLQEACQALELQNRPLDLVSALYCLASQPTPLARWAAGEEVFR